MSQVENYPVALRDWAVIECFWLDDAEYLFAPGARVLEAFLELVE
jgi:hypothetical protein